MPEPGSQNPHEDAIEALTFDDVVSLQDGRRTSHAWAKMLRRFNNALQVKLILGVLDLKGAVEDVAGRGVLWSALSSEAASISPSKSCRRFALGGFLAARDRTLGGGGGGAGTNLFLSSYP